MADLANANTGTALPLPPGGRHMLASVLAVGVAIAGLVLANPLAMAAGFGPLSHHMAVHILLMDAVAPAFAFAVPAATREVLCGRRLVRSLALATVVQLLVLWAWHAPPALDAAVSSATARHAMQASLFAVAAWFWLVVLAQRGARRWRSIFALLVTAKLFCLLAVVLVFAPRPLYDGAAALHAASASGALADQQLAGLLMLAACPLTYVLAGIVIAARWLTEIETRPERGAGGI